MDLPSHHDDPRFHDNPRPGEIIAADDADVLPRLDVSGLTDALRRLPEEELVLSLRTKLVPLVALPGLKLFAACGPKALAMARNDGLRVVASADTAGFISAARQALGPSLLAEATNGLSRRSPMLTARRRFHPQQLVMAAGASAVTAVAALVLPGAVSWAIASLVSGLFFLSVIALRLLCLMPPPTRPAPHPPPLSDAELPVYSVLVPLFRETSVLRQLLHALVCLDYPAEKLDIKLILEETDILMQRAVAGLALPPHFDVIVVPAGTPQTKPRALNYALQFAHGTLLTIFDAEDVPEPRQLRLAAEAFAVQAPDVACLQAQLAFYNPNENWLTRQFTIEYAILFDLILPALAAHRLPLPLGGTSNHFRTGALRQAGAWDAYNVTEDADLGIRLARLGFETGTITSRTFEEANTRLPNWMRQRARWMKGFLITWLVHMREPLRLLQEVGPAAFCTIQAVTLGVFASALLHPLCLVATMMLMAHQPVLPAKAGLAVIALAGLNLLIFVAGYAVTMIAGRRGLGRLGIAGWFVPIATMPLYWLLMSAAAWLALWQFATAPFHWNKTEHGLSVFQRRPSQTGVYRGQPVRHRPR